MTGGDEEIMTTLLTSLFEIPMVGMWEVCMIRGAGGQIGEAGRI